MDELCSISAGARTLGGLSEHTINKWLTEGKLTRVKIGSRTMLKVAELQQIIESGIGGKSARPGKPIEAPAAQNEPRPRARVRGKAQS